MSDSVLVGLLAFFGAIVGAAIGALGTIVAAVIRATSERESVQTGDLSWVMIALIATLAASGLVLGLIVGTLLLQPKVTSQPNTDVAQTIPSAPNLGTEPIVILPTASNDSAIPTDQPTLPEIVSTPEPLATETPTATASPTPTGTPVPTFTPSPTQQPTPDPRNVLVNGDFREDWIVGWRRSVEEASSATIIHEVIDSPQGRTGRALHLLCADDTGKVHIFQEVPVSHLNYLLRGSLSLNAGNSSDTLGGIGFAYLKILFIDSSGEVIGELMYFASEEFEPSSSNTRAVTRARSGWNTYELHLQQLASALLTGLNQNNVVKLNIILGAGGTTGFLVDVCTGCRGELYATNLELIDLSR